MPDAAAGAVPDEIEPELNPELLNMVLAMGIPENPAKHALYKTGGSDADMAVTWYFDNMADESIQLPLRIKNPAAAAGGGAEPGGGGDNVPQESLDMMTVMGFPEKKCRKALKKCDLNVERAMDWLFSHADDPDSEEDEPMNAEPAEDLNAAYKCEKPGVYQLQSFITHLGASVHAGHYVCHIKKAVTEGDAEKQWVYYNDAKVAATSDPPIGKGFMYFFTKP